ncbi:hypothetical protein JXL21_03525 [Candidatus Bathyarchaeota archaeon]|nr:hypothetical protein [Candidatus Bathyarchaeota archaeon]
MTLLVVLLVSAAPKVSAEPVQVECGVRVINIEKVDLAANTYRLDFYLWFSWDPGLLSMKQVQDFEFLNGVPSKDVVYFTEEEGFLQYRVRGDFLKTFDFSKYPFEVYNLAVTIEHKNMNSTALVYVLDVDSGVDEGVNVVGWDYLGFCDYFQEHELIDNSFSNYVFQLKVGRPFLSSVVKNVLPITVITVISLLTFFIAPQNFGQRISLAVSTLMAASAFHINLLNALPPTGYLTLADRMMLTVYIIFLYNLGTSVYIMRLVDSKKNEDASRINQRAARLLMGIIAVMVILLLLF